MKKTREQKAITLIALIITIVVLLILAVVAITSVQNDSIIEYANNAVTGYKDSQTDERTELGDYEGFIDSYKPGGNGGTGGNGGSGNGSGGGPIIGDATVGVKVTTLSTINGQAYNENNPVIPVGFIPINTTETTGITNWDATDLAAEVKKGLVITDSVDSNGVSNGNEFVWIPVGTISEMAAVTSGVDENGRPNYQGVLYDFENDNGTLKATANSTYVQGTENYREPANLTSSAVADNADKFITEIKAVWNESYY